MKAFVALTAILAVLGCVVLQAAHQTSSVPLTLTELSSSIGSGFWGGLLCGAAAGGVAVGVAAALTAASGGVGSPLAIGIGTSLSLHVYAVCLMV